MPSFRVTEQVATVVEICYDVTAPDDDADTIDTIEEHLDRETDEVHREVVRCNREVIGVERMDDPTTDQTFTVTFRHWGDYPLTEGLLLEALQDSLGPGERLQPPTGTDLEGIYITKVKVK